MDLLENFGREVLEKRQREGLGLRAAAKDMGITHATLSRIEKGFHPDLATFQKAHRWLKGAEAELVAVGQVGAPQVHFRREKTISIEMAQSLAQMIILAQERWGLSPSLDEQFP